MHRDPDGRLHVSIVIYGPWSHALDHDLRWFMHALPPWFERRRISVPFETVWFSQVQCLLPPKDSRPEPIQLHVSAMSGTASSDALELHLLARADGVVFLAENVDYGLDVAREYRGRLDHWLAQRGDDAILVFQIDDPEVTTVYTTHADGPSTTDPVTVSSLDTLRRELRMGDRACFPTKARDFVGVNDVFKSVTQALQDAPFVDRPLLAPIERL